MLRYKTCILVKHIVLFISSVSKDANQAHKIQLVQAICKYIWNDTCSLEPLPEKLDMSNTEESIRDKNKLNDCPWGMKLAGSLPSAMSVRQQIK